MPIKTPAIIKGITTLKRIFNSPWPGLDSDISDESEFGGEGLIAGEGTFVKAEGEAGKALLVWEIEGASEFVPWFIDET